MCGFLDYIASWLLMFQDVFDGVVQGAQYRIDVLGIME